MSNNIRIFKPTSKVTPKIYNPPVWPWGKAGIHNAEGPK